MPLLEIDRERCHQDGICAEICPAQIITLDKATDYPALVPGGDDRCIRCGHCVAVCPHGALNHAAMAAADCPVIDHQRLPDADQVTLFLRARRSIRRFKAERLNRETLAGLIDAARYAPSGVNRQPVRWLVVQTPQEVHRMAGLVADWSRHLMDEGAPMVAALHLDKMVAAWDQGQDRICRDAPHLIVAHASQADPTAPAAATIALTYLELAAAALGLGACWAGYFNVAANLWSPLKEALDLPEGHTSFGAMMVGRPQYRYHRLPLRNEAEILWR